MVKPVDKRIRVVLLDFDSYNFSTSCFAKQNYDPKFCEKKSGYIENKVIE